MEGIDRTASLRTSNQAGSQGSGFGRRDGAERSEPDLEVLDDDVLRDSRSRSQNVQFGTRSWWKAMDRRRRVSTRLGARRHEELLYRRWESERTDRAGRASRWPSETNLSLKSVMMGSRAVSRTVNGNIKFVSGPDAQVVESA